MGHATSSAITTPAPAGQLDHVLDVQLDHRRHPEVGRRQPATITAGTTATPCAGHRAGHR